MIDVLKGDPLEEPFRMGQAASLRKVAADVVRAQAILRQAPLDLLVDAASLGIADHYAALEEGRADDEIRRLDEEKSFLEGLLPTEERTLAVFLAQEALPGAEVSLQAAA